MASAPVRPTDSATRSLLILDVAPAVARSRKTEVSVDEGIRQYSGYRALASDLPCAHLIDANRSVDEVVMQCERVIVAAMATRLKRRSRSLFRRLRTR